MSWRRPRSSRRVAGLPSGERPTLSRDGFEDCEVLMRARTTRGITRKRRHEKRHSLLVVASGCQEPAVAVELMAGSLTSESTIQEASCQTTAEGFAFLMSLVVTGGPVAVRRAGATLRKIAERHGIVLTVRPTGDRGGLT